MQPLASSNEAHAPQTLREQIAALLTESPIASNYEAMCSEMADRRQTIRAECPDCTGLGFRPHSAQDLREFQLRIAERERGGAKYKSIEAERERFGLESVCRTCKGRGWVPQQPDEGYGYPDSLWTTVQCERCTGSFKTSMGRYRGTSCGEQIPPNDESAERGDVCPACLGDAYQVPITARPIRRGGGFLYGSVNEEDERPPKRVRDYRPAQRDEDTDAAAAVERIRSEAPELALGMGALLGEHGDRWGQHVWSRRFALWPLTEAGRLIYEEAGLASGESDPYAKRLDVIAKERAAELEGPSRERRRALIALADEQSRTLERRIERAIREMEAAQ
jgi:hypothetical protein